MGTSNSAVSDFQQPRLPGTPSFYRCFLGSKKNESLYGSFLNRVVINQQRHSPRLRLEQPSSDLGIFSKELDGPSKAEDRPQSIIDILIDDEAIRKQEELLAKSVGYRFRKRVTIGDKSRTAPIANRTARPAPKVVKTRLLPSLIAGNENTH